MHPKTDKGLACDGLALSDFVLVVRENVVDPATVYIQYGTEVFHRHSGAFQMPTRAAGAKWRIPARFLVVFRDFPEDKVPRLFLFIFIGIDAGADLQFAFIEMR